MSIMILINLILMIFRKGKDDNDEMNYSWPLSFALGLSSGFATIIGDAAGSLMSLYLLLMRFPKNFFITAGGVFFGIVNFIKFPFHVFYW